MSFFEMYDALRPFEGVFMVRLVLAMLLGGIIGLERERKNHSAGFRTHILVTVGSCIFMLVSLSMPTIIQSMPGGIVNNADPGRIAAQVVSGIGFLGAGAIIQSKERRVHGLTTAASLWVVAAIGLAVGAGLYLTSIVGTLLLFLVLTWFVRLEDAIAKADKQRKLIKKIQQSEREMYFSGEDFSPVPTKLSSKQKTPTAPTEVEEEKKKNLSL